MKGAMRPVAIALGLLCLIGVATAGARSTGASWVDQDTATATVDAVPAPSTATGATCKPNNVVVLGLQDVTLSWTSPLPLAFQRVDISKNGVTGSDTGQIQQTSQSSGGYSFSAKYTKSKLLGLVNLGDLLGGTYDIAIQTGYPGSSWYAPPRTLTLSVAALGLSATCS